MTAKDMMQENLSSRFLKNLFIGVGITCILTLIEVCIFLLVNPFQGASHTTGLSALFTFSLHTPWGLLTLIVELMGASLLAVLGAKPLALIAYLRDAHVAQEEYHKLYTPLTALTNIRKTSEFYSQDSTAPTVSIQEQEVSILDLVQQQNSHQLILGVPGAGKTTALRVYQYIVSQQPLTLVLKRERLPVYVPMKNYSLYLKKHHLVVSDPAQAVQQVTLLDFLRESDLPGMRHLGPYLSQLSQQGRLLLLCDGLNEVDSNYLTYISEELVGLMRDTRNRLVMTCREVDYREQEEFVQLVEEGQVARAVIYPLQPEQVSEFVERYVEKQDRLWQHTAGQIMQVIDRSRLRYHCTNPMMLFTLMGIIDKIGVERGKQIDTRGRLLRESVRQLIEYEQRQAKWSKGAPEDKEVLRFLSEVACAARWANDRNAIQLRVSTVPAAMGSEVRGGINFDELADELGFWLDEHPAMGPFVVDDDAEPEPHNDYTDLSLLLQFALSATLIEVSPNGVLSFKHELIAEYFVAEYFFAAKRPTSLAIREELLENVGRWSEPVAVWAGLLDNPLTLADRFGSLGRSNPAYILQALALALVCIGVLWTPPQAEIQRTVILPSSVEEALSIAVRNRAAREELASIFTRCAEEGGQEVYRSLLPLIMVDGVDELLTLLDQTIVPDLLFIHLQDAVDNVAYEAQVKRLTRVLGRFGGVVVDRAVQLSQLAAERSPRLRAAAINILGGTNDLRAVEPLITRLSDMEPFIVERAANALIRLGPELVLTRILQTLENRITSPFTVRIHRAALAILGRFLDEPDVNRQVTHMQHQRILESIVPVLTSNYQNEPEVQQQARELLVRQGRRIAAKGALDARADRSARVIEALMRYLPSQNEVAVRNVIQALQEIGTPAAPRLLELLNQPSDIVRTRVIEILKAIHDPRALPSLLRLVSDPAPLVQQQIASALQAYIPESIPGLIELVLSDPSELVADRAAEILGSIGALVVIPVTDVLFDIVSGRTRLLVQVLEQVHDPQSIPALTTLLETPQIEPLLAVSIVRALSQFQDKRVVPSLLNILSDSRPQIYEEAVNALSQLGALALDGLVAALDVSEESAVTQRMCRAILGMNPFPGEQLVNALGHASEIQVQQIMVILKAQGADAAQILVKYLLHKDERVRGYVYQILYEMPGPTIVPALLEVLNQPALRKVVNTILLKYPDAAILPLVDLLGENERGDAAAIILPQFGTRILRSLISGLDDPRNMARERARRIIVSLARQSEDSQEILSEVVQLFNPPLPVRARELLLDVLTNELADVSIPVLQDGLEDAYLLEDVSDAYARLARKGSQQNIVLDNLIKALYVEERRRGAEIALLKIGAPAVQRVGELIVDPNQAIAKAAKQILREIGVPALSFIWTAHSDKANVVRRDAALEVFHGMRTDVIKDELVSLLVSEKPDDVAMAVALLLERIHDEASQRYADRVMIPELIEYVQTHGIEETNLRVISLLLLLGEHAIFDHLVQTLDDYPQHRKQLIYILLLLGTETQEALLDVFNDPGISAELRAEIAAVLGMMMAPDVIAEFAQNLSNYGVSSTKTSFLQPELLTISLRALGGLLAGGHWDARKLQEMRSASEEGSPEHELFSILVGWRYEPQLAKLQNELQSLQEAHRKEVMTLTTRIVTDQSRIQSLTDELEQVHREHGFRSDELHQAIEDRETMRTGLDQAVKEYNALRVQLQRALQENQVLHEQNQQLIRRINQSGAP